MLHFRAAIVLAEGHVAHPVMAFNFPMAAIECEKLSGVGALSREAGDRVGNLGRGLAVRFHNAFDATHLLQARPIEMPGQAPTGL